MMFFVFRLQKNCGVSCAKDRPFSSSIPVRYIPKNSSKPEESRHSSPLKDFEEKVMGNCLDSKALTFEISHSVRNVKNSIPTIHHQNKNQIPTNSFLFGDAKPGIAL